MALTGTPPPAPAQPVPPFLGPTGPPPAARASLAGQAATYGVVVLGLLLVWGALDQLPEVPFPIIGLSLGIVVGVTTVAGAWVEKFPGVVAAFISFVVVALVLGLTGGGLPVQTLAVVPLFFVGLDWRLVSRLRLLPFLAGLAILGPVGTERGWAYPAALAWLVVAVGALWVLQNDERTALARPAPLGGPPDDGPPASPVDLARTLGLALLAGLALAFLISRPSCSPATPPVDPQVQPPNLDPGQGGRPARPGEVPPERSFGDAGDRTQPNGEGGSANGGEREIQVDEDGRRYVEDPVTGERYDVTEQGGRQVVRDGDGNVVGEIGPDGSVTANGGEPGDVQRYEVDEDGRLYVETSDGERLYVEETGDGDVVLRDGDGRVVARGGESDDHLYVEDPDGDTLVPDADGDGRIPVPNGGIRDGLPGSTGDGTTYRRSGDRTIATDEDGERRTYDEDFVGRPRVKVERPGEDDRTYVYDGSGPYRSVLEYDEDGRLIKRYRYDPEGVTVDDTPTDITSDGSGGSGSGRGGSGAGSEGFGPNGSGQEGSGQQGGDAGQDGGGQDDEGSPPWGTIGLVALVVAAAIGLGVFLWKRRTPPTELRNLPWALALVARISEHGTAHGRPRGRDQSIAAYTAALAAGPIPDRRLPEVGQILSAAFFAPEPPTAEERAWAEAAVAQIVEAHPVPGRAERKAAKDAAKV